MLFDAQASVRDNVILGRFPVAVDRGCDALEVQAPLAAAILAFPAPWRLRVGGATLGVALVWAVNVLRIASPGPLLLYDLGESTLALLSTLVQVFHHRLGTAYLLPLTIWVAALAVAG